MPRTRKSVVRDVKRLYDGFSCPEVPTTIELKEADIFRAEYIASIEPTANKAAFKFAAKVGVGLVVCRRDYAAQHTNVHTRAGYKLAGIDRVERLQEHSLVIPENLADASHLVRLPELSAKQLIIDHCLLLASSEAAKRGEIPDMLEARLAAAAQHPQTYLDAAFTSALDAASDVVATVRAFETSVGITQPNRSAARVAIFGNDFEGMTRLSPYTTI